MKLPPWSAIRRHGLAALIAAHLVIISIAALPAPGIGLSAATWQDESVQAEFRAWGARLHVPARRLEELAWPVARTLQRVQQTLTRPLRPYLSFTGTWQTWALFVAPERSPAHFQLLARGVDGSWETLFEERSPTSRWQADYFEFHRVRRALWWNGWPPTSGGAEDYCHWIAGRVFRERPAVAVVRCRFWRAPVPSPAEARAGVQRPGTWVQEFEVARP